MMAELQKAVPQQSNGI